MAYNLIAEMIPAVTGGLFDFERDLSAAADSALGRSVVSILAADIINTLSLMTNPSNDDTWPLYISSMPDGDAVETNCGAIYDTAGVLDGKISDGEVIQHPGIQISIRSDNYETGYAKIEAIALALDDTFLDTITIGGDTYSLRNISRTTPVIPLGSERGYKRRFVFVVNFLVTLNKIV